MEAVGEYNIINRAIYGLRFPSKFKIIKVAHAPIDKQLYVHRWLRGGKTLFHPIAIRNLKPIVGPLLVKVLFKKS